MYYNRETDEENYVNGHFTDLKWQGIRRVNVKKELGWKIIKTH